MGFGRAAIRNAALFAVIGAGFGLFSDNGPWWGFAFVMALFGLVMGPLWHLGDRRAAAEDQQLAAAVADPASTELATTWIDTLRSGGTVPLTTGGFGPTLTPSGVRWRTIFRTSEVAWSEVDDVRTWTMGSNGFRATRMVRLRSGGKEVGAIGCSKQNFDDVLSVCTALAAAARS